MQGLFFLVIGVFVELFTCLLLRRFDSEAGEAGELEARELGTSTRGITVRREKRGETTSPILSPSLHPLRAHPFRSERDVWERGRLFTVMIWLSFFWVAMYSKKETGNL